MYLKRFKSYLNNTRGNTAMILSIVAVPLMLGAGAAVDTIRAADARIKLQSAADAAALAGAASGKTTAVALDKIVKDYLDANGAAHVVSSVKKINQKYDKVNRTFAVSIEAKMDTSFMFLAGYSDLDIGAKAEVTLGGAGLEVVLALDNTASMNSGGRLPALKTAAHSLIDTIFDDLSSGVYLKAGIVPFSNYVNVGLGNRNASWIEVDADHTVTTPYTYDSYPNATSSNCKTVEYTAYNDGVPYQATTNVCDWVNGDPVPVSGVSVVNYVWNGCVGSRIPSLATKINGIGNKYTGVLKTTYNYPVECAQPITPLTNDPTVLHAAVDSMVGTQNTYIAPGVLWGWNMLDPSEPLVGAKTKTWMKANKGTKALVLMSDGDNTLSAVSPRHDDYNVAEANKATKETCVNAKKDDIVIYTVSFMITDAAALKIMNDCASDASKAFSATSSDALTDAFDAIAKDLKSTRLSK